ncbi:MAG: nucleotidyltransferase family protein [Prevotella sp.]|jgi:dTDP-glucose pyrophosphorylase|nr:nucleotidyltransferase family protein [Prevotella sp.]
MTEYSKYIISNKASIQKALLSLNQLSSEALTLFVIDENEVMIGTLTDGDTRRKLIEGCNLSDSVLSVMNPNFHYVRKNDINVQKIKLIKEKGIVLIPVLDEKNRICQIFNLKKKKSILPLDVVLMAGGKGERLRPLTENMPKPLLLVGDKCIIDHNIDRLIEFGINNINVTVNYLKEQIIDHFRKPRNETRINCITEPCYLGTIGSVKFIETFHNDYILVMNSDLFTNINYEDLFLHFINNNADMSVVAVPYTVSIPYGVFDLDGRNIKGIQEKPVFNYYANAGIYLFKKELLKHIPDNEFFNATDFIDVLVEKGYNVIRFPLTGYWIDIGKHEEYKKAQELVKHM